MSFRRYLAGCLLVAATVFFPSISSAALIGVSPEDPKIDFGGAGVVDYDVATQTVTISGVPATLVRNIPFLFVAIGGTGPSDERLFTIKLKVNPTTGAFVSGITASDIQIIGSVDTNGDGTPEYSGVLLEAEVSAFGFQDSAFGTTDAFDLKATVTGGSLTTGTTPLYTNGSQIAIQVFSEVSGEYLTPFTGSFQANFTGPAKGVLGSVAPVVVGQCKIDVEAYCSVDGSTFKSKCRIAQHKSPHFWDHEDRNTHGQTYKRYSYGLHGTTEPAWSVARASQATPVTFKYVVKNKGTTPISGIDIDDSFDTPISGYPLSLAAGASFSVTRTERLRESIENTVLVTGLNGGAQCSDSDTVSVKEKLRERRKHDDDNFEDKGKDDGQDRR